RHFVTTGLLTGAVLLATLPAHAQAWRAAASADATTCGSAVSVADGGAGATLARSVLDERRDCTEPAALGNASAAASVAQGFALVSTRVAPAAGDDVTARADFTDVVQIVDVPPEQATVQLRVTIALTADGDIQPDDPGNFLFGRITVPGAGDYELRRCSIAVCPDDPIASDLLSEVITVPRLGADFGSIGVAASVTLRTEDGQAFLRSDVTIDILDTPDARLASASGQYGTQTASDTDADGLPDLVDNCTQRANRPQRDTDDDALGNACDPDLNNDGVVNVIDLGLLRAAIFSSDAAADFDGDGAVNMVDVGRLRQFFFGPPGPGLPAAAATEP
ncbi:MAG: dockerin type I repeat-containing protein, partial [Pseudomonadota bacterium]